MLKRYVQPDDNVSNKDGLIKLLGKNAYGNDWNHIFVDVRIKYWIGEPKSGAGWISLEHAAKI